MLPAQLPFDKTPESWFTLFEIKIPLCRICQSMLAIPCSHHVRNWSAANRAPGTWVPSQLPSVTQISICEDWAGQNWLTLKRMVDAMFGISFSGEKSWLLLG